MMTKTKQIGNVMADMSAWSNPSVGRVYDKKGLCPTINTCGGGWQAATHYSGGKRK